MRKANNLPPYCAVVKKSRSLNFLDPSGPAWPVTGVLYLFIHTKTETAQINCIRFVCSVNAIIYLRRSDLKCGVNLIMLIPRVLISRANFI